MTDARRRLSAYLTLIVWLLCCPVAQAQDDAESGAVASAIAIAASSDDRVIGIDGEGRERWALPFPHVAALIVVDDVAYAAVAHQVVMIDEEGQVVGRIATSGRVSALEADRSGGVIVTSLVTHAGGWVPVVAVLRDGALLESARFDPLGDFFGALAAEADVADPAARLARDPTNPFLHLHVALTSTEAERDAAAAAAIAAVTTFFDGAQLAHAFVRAGLREEAAAAWAVAHADFTARGYDAGLLTDRAVHDRYFFPLGALERALAEGDDDAADAYAAFLVDVSGPDLPGAGAALRAYAASLGRRGMREEAALAREWAGERTNTSAQEALARNALLLGRGGTIASLALALALVVQHLTLFAKYRRAQQLALRQHTERGERSSRWWALRAIRYYGTTEKVVLLTLLAVAYATVALHDWVGRGDAVVGVLGVGTSETLAATALIASATGDPGSVAWARAYQAGAVGDLERARMILDGADEAPTAVLASLARGDGVPAPPPSVWRAAVAGRYQEAIATAFRNPATLFDARLAMLGLPAWSWPIQLALFWLIVVWHAFWLPIRRPTFAREAPRPFGYEVAALLSPGTGQADELYGLLLLIPWSIVVIDVIAGVGVLGIPTAAGVTILVVTYTVNTIAWGIEFAATRSRLQRLVREQPALAQSFGLRVADPEAGRA
jgi:hypothetical protein